MVDIDRERERIRADAERKIAELDREREILSPFDPIMEGYEPLRVSFATSLDEIWISAAAPFSDSLRTGKAPDADLLIHLLAFAPPVPAMLWRGTHMSWDPRDKAPTWTHDKDEPTGPVAVVLDPNDFSRSAEVMWYASGKRRIAVRFPLWEVSSLIRFAGNARYDRATGRLIEVTSNEWRATPPATYRRWESAGSEYFARAICYWPEGDFPVSNPHLIRAILGEPKAADNA